MADEIEIKSDQRIARLTPLADLLAHIQTHVKPVLPRHFELSKACHLTLSEDIRIANALPAQSIALQDGYAVDSESTCDASSYAPVMIAKPAFVNAGDVLPLGTDSVLPEDAVLHRGESSEVQLPATIGDGVLASGADAEAAAVLFNSGHALRGSDIAALNAAGVGSISARAPCVTIQCVKKRDRMLQAVQTWMAHAVTAAGGHVLPESDETLERTVGNDNCDAAIVIGGTGNGRNDKAVTALAHIGEVSMHGIAITPGETAAFGYARGKPILLVPGRLDAALACWLFIGEKMLNSLSGRRVRPAGHAARLTQKVASSLGMTELVLVARNGEEAHPFATGYLPLQAIARADGWISVSAQSEGYPAGTNVIVRSLP